MKYKIRMPLTEYKELELDFDQCRNITRNFLREVFDIPDQAYLKNGNLMVSVEYHTSHSWFKEEIHRKEKERDKYILDLLQYIRNHPSI